MERVQENGANNRMTIQERVSILEGEITYLKHKIKIKELEISMLKSNLL